MTFRIVDTALEDEKCVVDRQHQQSTPVSAAADTNVNTKAGKAAAVLASAIDRHGKASIMFSGGKESLVLAHLAEPFTERVELVWVNTGAMFPHMVEFIRGYGNRFKLVELHSNLLERFNTEGGPSMIVPVANTRYGCNRSKAKDLLMISDWPSCCATMRSKPAIDYLGENQISLAIHGQRAGDDCISAFGLHTVTCEVVALLWDWSTEDIYTYLRAHRVDLPEQYPEVESSLECWPCTAYPNAKRLKWMRRRYPEHYQELRRMMQTVYDAAAFELGKMISAFREVDEEDAERRAPAGRER